MQTRLASKPFVYVADCCLVFNAIKMTSCMEIDNNDKEETFVACNGLLSARIVLMCLCCTFFFKNSLASRSPAGSSIARQLYIYFHVLRSIVDE